MKKSFINWTLADFQEAAREIFRDFLESYDIQFPEGNELAYDSMEHNAYQQFDCLLYFAEEKKCPEQVLDQASKWFEDWYWWHDPEI